VFKIDGYEIIQKILEYAVGSLVLALVHLNNRINEFSKRLAVTEKVIEDYKELAKKEDIKRLECTLKEIKEKIK